MRNNSKKLYNARVKKISHECDLAILEVDSDDFWQDMSPLSFANIPPLGEVVSVVGFPEGSEEICVSKGLVTSVKFHNYTHSDTELLVICVDANIISGYSGGPVITQGKFVGVAFQSVDFEVYGANTGSVIPTCVVKHFLSSLEESDQQSGFGSLAITYRENYYRMDQMTGITIHKICSFSGAHKIMEPYDLLHAIDNIPIGNDGTIPFRNKDRVDFRYLVSMKKPCDTLMIKFSRDIKHYIRSSYYIFRGFVFVHFTEAYVEDVQSQTLDDAFFAEVELKAKELEAGEELVMLSRVLRDDINQGFQCYENLLVEKINGVKVNNLAHLIELIEGCRFEYLILDLQMEQVAGIHYESAKEKTAEILERYNIFLLQV